MTYKVKVLGCGGSMGVPYAACDCAVCKSTDPRNKRTRPSILFETTGGNVLIDASTDFRAQALANNVQQIDALVITHNHADHVNGMDDLRPFTFKARNSIPLYCTAEVFAALMQKFPYLFVQKSTLYKPILVHREIEYYSTHTICGTKFTFFKQIHGEIASLGVRVLDFAYSTDFKFLEARGFQALQGIKTWIIDCQKFDATPSHLNLEEALAMIERVRPSHAYLTHLTHDFDYEDLLRRLPSSVVPCVDGLEIMI